MIQKIPETEKERPDSIGSSEQPVELSYEDDFSEEEYSESDGDKFLDEDDA